MGSKGRLAVMVLRSAERRADNQGRHAHALILATPRGFAKRITMPRAAGSMNGH